MTGTRRSTYTILALAAGLLAVSLLLAVSYRPQAPTHGSRGEPRPGRNLPADSRALPPGAVERLGFARGKGLPGRTEISTAAYSADGKVIVTADWTGAANVKGFQLWDAETGEPVGEVPTPIRVLYGVSPSPDGKRLAWAGNDAVPVMGVSDVTTGDVLWRSKGGIQVSFTPDGRRVVCGQFSGAPQVVDAATGAVVHTLSEPGRFAGFVLSRDGTTVVTSSQKASTQNYDPPEPRVEVWDVATGRRRKIVAAQQWPFGFRESLAVSADGKSVAFTGNGRLVLADVEAGAERWRVANPVHHHFWESLAFSPSGDTLLGIRNDIEAARVTIDLLDAKTGRTLRSLDGEADQFSRGAFSPDGRRVITFGHGVPFRMWDAATGRLLPAYEGHRSAPQSLAISDDGNAVLSADRYYTACVWGVPALRTRFDFRYVRSTGLSGDGRTAVVTTGDSATLLLDLTNNTRRVLARYQSQFSAISRDGKRAAVSTVGDAIEMIDLGSGKVLQTLTGHTGDLYALAFSADGRRLLSASKTRPRSPFIEEFKEHAAPIPDDTIRVWDLATGKEIRRWERAAGCAALSGDNRMMIAGGADGRVRRMDVDTGKELEPLELHAGSVGAVATSPDGMQAASAGTDAIVLWDVATGRERRRFAHDHGTPTALAFSGDGRRLISAGADGTILMWDTPRE